MEWMHKKWQRLESCIAFQNSFIRVYDEKVVAPTGASCSYGRVHFKRKAASVLLVDFKNSKLLLIGQSRYPIDKYSWETVQGGGNHSSDFIEIAKKELAEEAGLISSSFHEICVTHTSNSVTDEIAKLFWCNIADTAVVGSSQLKDSCELLQSKWFSFTEAENAVRSGLITDSVTQISILSLFRFIRNDSSF